MRLIDADALDDVMMGLNFKKNRGITRGEYKLIDSILFEFPTIEQPQTGKWIPVEDSDCWRGYVCDKCGKTVNQRENFCPNCGKRMVKE